MKRVRVLALVTACVIDLSSTVYAEDASWGDLMATGNQLMEENHFAGAAEIFRLAVADAQASGGSVRTGISLDHLGIAYDALGRDREAEGCLKQAIAVLESSAGDGSPYTNRAWTDLAGLYLRQRRYGPARTLAERALAVLARQPPADPTETVLVLTLLASIEMSLRKPAHAEAYCRQAMEMLDRAGQSQSREWINAANNLGILLLATNRPEEGERYLRESLLRGETVLQTGAEKLMMGQILANLAKHSFTLRRFDETEKCLSRALNIFESELGSLHPFTGDILVQYAALCRAMKRKTQAKEYDRRANECLKPVGHSALKNSVDLSELRERRR